MSERPALVRQHEDSAPPALLSEWAAERGIPLEVQRTDGPTIPDPDLTGRPFVVSLGSKYSPVDRDIPAVVAELELIKRAVAGDIPVLGLCYGAQVLAAVLGGEIQAAPEPELGWHRISSQVPAEIPDGPWLQWHYQRFTLPPGADELARSPRALQAFAHGRHLAVQFHPEATVEIVQSWARMDTEHLAELGISDGEALAAADRGRGGERPRGGLHPVRRLPAASPPCREERSVNTTSLDEVIPGGLAAAGGETPITSIRLLFPDLHGIARGKDVPASEFGHVIDHGLCFCAAVMGTDLRHTPVVGGEAGYPDLVAMPDLDTMVQLPWEPGVACCLADLESSAGGPAPADARGALRRAVAAWTDLGFEPIVGPELEFFLVVRDPEAPNGIRRLVDNLSMVYTVGPQADPGGLVRRMTDSWPCSGSTCSPSTTSS